MVETNISSSDALPVCLWKENPYSLVSLWDMTEFAGSLLCGCVEMLLQLELTWMQARLRGDSGIAALLTQEVNLTRTEREQLKATLEGVEAQLRESGLATSGETLKVFGEDLLDLANYPKMSNAMVVSRIRETKRTMAMEMKSVVFLYVPTEKAQLYTSPLKDWDNVLARWPVVKDDIIEASKSLALDRFAGALFHILLVAEFGVIQVCNLFGKSGDKPGWGCVDRLQQIKERPFKDRGPLEQQHSKLLDAVPDMISLKADRHKLMHVDNKGDWLWTEIGPGTATDGIATARRFMRRLAAELPQVPR